jgi:hypothetical protein
MINYWVFGILEALMRVGVERFRFGCFGPAKLTLTIDQHQSIKEIINALVLTWYICCHSDTIS